MIDAFLQTMMTFLLFYGLWETGNIKLRGPAVMALAEVFSFLVGVERGLVSLQMIGVVLFIGQVRAFVSWRGRKIQW